MNKKDLYLIDLIKIPRGERILGRISTFVVKYLRGKQKIDYIDYLDKGDSVIILNANLLELTGNKMKKKIYYSHSQYPGGLKSINAQDFFDKKGSDKMIYKSIKNMMPKTKLAKNQLKNLFIYKNDQHQHKTKDVIELEFHQGVKVR
jgi:large subunit ribosomal protein L13